MSNYRVSVKVLAVLFLITGPVNFGYSQKIDSVIIDRNSIYVDFASKGAIYSLNYDRVFHQRKKISLSYRVGFSILEDAIAFPVGINIFTSKSNSHLEFGLTMMPFIDHYKSFLSKNDLSDKYLYVIPSIGYRYQKSNGGLFLKIGISPTIFLDPPSDNFWKMDPKLYFLANIGLGLSF